MIFISHLTHQRFQLLAIAAYAHHLVTLASEFADYRTAYGIACTDDKN